MRLNRQNKRNQKSRGKCCEISISWNILQCLFTGFCPICKSRRYRKKGQVLGIVEAMKLMNEIESEFDGVVKEIQIENEQVVEYGQPLFVIG